jgi:hypothetical protein
MYHEYIHIATGIQTVGFVEKDMLGIVMLCDCDKSKSFCVQD